MVDDIEEDLRNFFENDTPQGAFQRNHIELSTVYFYKKKLPRLLKLKECDFTRNSSGVPDTLAALTGYQRRQKGFVIAREYAEKNGLEFTVIDFTIKLDQSFSAQLIKPEDLQLRDYLSIHRLSKDTTNLLLQILKESGDEQTQNILKLHSTKKLSNLLKYHPALLDPILTDERFKHVKIINTNINNPLHSDVTLNLAFVPKRNWRAIQSASCRLDPSIEISLEPPQSTVALQEQQASQNAQKPEIKGGANEVQPQENQSPQTPGNRVQRPR